MNSKNRYDGIDPYAVKLIRHRAGQLIGHYGFTQDDRDDIEQELALVVLMRLPEYDSKRAKLSTFIALVVDHKIADIIEARIAGKRDYRLCCCSLNDLLEDDEGGSIERIDTLSEEEYRIQIGKLSRQEIELLDLCIDLRKAIEILPPELSDLCQRRMTYNVIRISSDTGIPRGTIYDMIKRIRITLEELGLGEYL